jgi:hypothetical protein
MKPIHLIILLGITALVSCSAEKKLERRIRGSWTIASYEEKNINGSDGKSTNVGTMTFLKNGTGQKKLSGIPWRKSDHEATDFKWESGNNTITIYSPGSAFAKTWIITRNKKSTQEWRSTSRGDVQTVVLKR